VPYSHGSNELRVWRVAARRSSAREGGAVSVEHIIGAVLAVLLVVYLLVALLKPEAFS
jgi:K+-transporting ATPase KdpF subunit